MSSSKPLAGEVIVFTGFRDLGLARRIAQLGGIYKDSLSKAVTTVVCKDEATLTTNKARAARERGLRVLTREEFEASPAASAGVIDFQDPAFLQSAGLPPPDLTAELTRAHGIACAVAVSDGTSSEQREVGASRLGGLPDLPAGVPWPRVGGVPMLFLAQIDLTHASLLDGCGVLPRHGWLLFFVAHDFAGDSGGSGRGGHGSSFGDAASDATQAIEDADPGPQQCALAPSRVIFINPGARLARRGPPDDMPDEAEWRMRPASQQPQWVRFETGGSSSARKTAEQQGSAAESTSSNSSSSASASNGGKRKGPSSGAAGADAGSDVASSGVSSVLPLAQLLGPALTGRGGFKSTAGAGLSSSSAPSSSSTSGDPLVLRCADDAWADVNGPPAKGTTHEWTVLLQLQLPAAAAKAQGQEQEKPAGKKRRSQQSSSSSSSSSSNSDAVSMSAKQPQQRLFFMMREADLRQKVFTRHYVVLTSSSGGASASSPLLEECG